jgi:hypothetical protein
LCSNAEPDSRNAEKGQVPQLQYGNLGTP